MAEQGSLQSALNLMRRANQIQSTGNINPPNLMRIPDKLLAAATPSGINLANILKVDTQASDKAIAACKNYQGVEGLRRLKADQATRSEMAPGCGWAYKESKGLVPEVNRGYFGTIQGPLETLPAGTHALWNLEFADAIVNNRICDSVQKCSQLKLLGREREVCGFCKSTNSIIPVEKLPNGTYKSRFTFDPSLLCPSADIVTATRGQCPPERFTNMSASQSAQITNPSLLTREGFALEDLEKCKSPLSRDCVLMAAREAGCNDKGTLITSLTQTPIDAKDNDQVLKTKPEFQVYMSAANPSITDAVLKDGSSSIDVALNDFGRIMQNMSSPNPRLAASAKALCAAQEEGFVMPDQEFALKGGIDRFETYSFCSEFQRPAQVINNEAVISCVQQFWKQNGGTEDGTGYPQFSTWRNKTFGDFLTYFNSLKQKIDSKNLMINTNAIKELTGVITQQPPKDTGIPKNINTQGSETIWIDLGNAISGSQPPIVLKSQLFFGTNGEAYPTFSSSSELTSKYGVKGNNIGLTTAYQLHFDTDAQVRYEVTVDDGFMISYKQNPFEGNMENDWGSWRFQGPTKYTQPKPYSISAKSGGNLVVAKYFQGGGLATWKWNMGVTRGNTNSGFRDPSVDRSFNQNIYFTQEPLAPWMQFEICEKKNLTKGKTLGFFEKRWNGPAAFAFSTGQPIYAFDTNSGSVAAVAISKGSSPVLPPTLRGYLDFNSSSYWHTEGMYAFTAFQTITICFNPLAVLADGAQVSIFTHANFSANIGVALFLSRQGSQYFLRLWVNNVTRNIPVTMNSWNLAVLQYSGYSDQINNVALHVRAMDSLKTRDGLRTFLSEIKTSQGQGQGQTIFTGPNDRRMAGYIGLGGKAPKYPNYNIQSFSGSVAWIHGFRNFLDTEELLSAEVNQTWINDWKQ